MTCPPLFLYCRPAFYPESSFLLKISLIFADKVQVITVKMEREDYNRQVEWLMGEIKDQVSHEKSIVWTVVGLLILFGSLNYMFYKDGNISRILPYAVMLGILLVYIVFNRMMHKRMLQVKTADELLSVYNILNIGEWIVAVAELLISLADVSLLGMVLYMVVWIAVKTNQKLFNMTELEVNVDRLRKIIKEGYHR